MAWEFPILIFPWEDRVMWMAITDRRMTPVAVV